MNSLLKDDLFNLKSKLENIEKEFEVKIKDVESKEERFKRLDQQMEEYLSQKDKVILLNVGGKKFQTKISTLLSVKDTLFHNIVTGYITKNEEPPKELFFDRGYTHFALILEYLRTKIINLKTLNRYDKEEVINELEYYGLSDILNISKKETYDLFWEQSTSKSGACTVNTNDKRNIRIHSNTCYTHFVTNKYWVNENFCVELETTVSQTDSYYYIGIVNESYNLTSNCMCCNPANSYYVQCDGSIHINGVKTNDTRFAWGSNKTTIGMKVMLQERKIYFYIPDKVELGPFTISNGSNFRVVAGHCNNGNGEITIVDCYAI